MFNLTPFDKEFSPDSEVPLNNQEVDMDMFFDEVYRLFAAGNASLALDKLSTIDEDDPEYTRALFYKSIILADSGDGSAGEVFMQSLISEAVNAKGDDFISDDDYIDYFNKGLDEYNSGDYEEALSSFNVSLGLKPDYAEALYYKAVTLGRLFEFNDALEVINRAIELDSNDDRFWNDKANFLSRLNRLDEAVECFNKANELNPTDSVILANKGFLYIQMQDYDNAVKSYKKACGLENNIHNLIGLANAYMEDYDFPNAEKYLQKASKINDEDIEYLTAMAHFMMYQEHLTESLAYWDKILENNPEKADVWIYKSIVYLMMNNQFEANKCIEKACEIDINILSLFDDGTVKNLGGF